MSILSYFTQEARDSRTVMADRKRAEILDELAAKAVNVRYFENGIWITIDGTRAFRVSNGSDLARRTIAVEEVEQFIKELRENWVSAHKNDRLEGRV